MKIQQALQELPEKPEHMARRAEWKEECHVSIGREECVFKNAGPFPDHLTVQDICAEDWEVVPKPPKE